MQLEIFMRDREDLSADEIYAKGQAIEIARYFPIRERFWLDRLADHWNDAVVFICGDGHIESFGRLLQKTLIPFQIVERGIGLTEADRRMELAIRYLKDHPELFE